MTKRSRDISAFKTAVKGCLSAHESYQGTSRELADSIQDLRKRFNVPGYAWQWASGYEEARRDQWYFKRMEHCYVMPDYSIARGKWNEYTEEQREVLRQNKSIAGGFWWTNKDGTLGRPHFVSVQIGATNASDSFREVTHAFRQSQA